MIEDARIICAEWCSICGVGRRGVCVAAGRVEENGGWRLLAGGAGEETPAPVNRSFSSSYGWTRSVWRGGGASERGRVRGWLVVWEIGTTHDNKNKYS